MSLKWEYVIGNNSHMRKPAGQRVAEKSEPGFNFIDSHFNDICAQLSPSNPPSQKTSPPSNHQVRRPRRFQIPCEKAPAPKGERLESASRAKQAASS